jgi:hypothetical protein
MKKVVLSGFHEYDRRRLSATKEKADPFANKMTLEKAAESKKTSTKGAVNEEMKAKTLAKAAVAAEEVAEQEAKDAADAAAKQQIKDVADAATKQATKDAAKDEEKAAKKAMEADSETKAIQKTAADKSSTTTTTTVKAAKSEIKDLKAEIKTDKKLLPEATKTSAKKEIKSEIKADKTAIKSDKVVVLDAEMKKSAKGTSTKTASATLPEGVTEPEVGTTLLPPKKNSKLGQVEGEVEVTTEVKTSAKSSEKSSDKSSTKTSVKEESSKDSAKESAKESVKESVSEKSSKKSAASSSSDKKSAAASATAADSVHRLLPSVHTIKGAYKAMKGQIKTAIIMAKPYILKTSDAGATYWSKHDAVRGMKLQIKGAISGERGIVETDDDDDYSIRKLVDETKSKIEKKMAAAGRA